MADGNSVESSAQSLPPSPEQQRIERDQELLTRVFGKDAAITYVPREESERGIFDERWKVEVTLKDGICPGGQRLEMVVSSLGAAPSLAYEDLEPAPKEESDMFHSGMGAQIFEIKVDGKDWPIENRYSFPIWINIPSKNMAHKREVARESETPLIRWTDELGTDKATPITSSGIGLFRHDQPVVAITHYLETADDLGTLLHEMGHLYNPDKKRKDPIVPIDPQKLEQAALDRIKRVRKIDHPDAETLNKFKDLITGEIRGYLDYLQSEILASQWAINEASSLKEERQMDLFPNDPSGDRLKKLLTTALITSNKTVLNELLDHSQLMQFLQL